MASKPSIPQGTRDFSAEVVRKRNYIFSAIRNIFELYSFQPLETPAMENLDTLMGKYGEEGDKLIFKILNNGINNENNIEKSKAGFEKLLEGKSSSDITERALKYDLTIPFARYVAMNHSKLTFPFRRYQIQPVWRADRPQKGRYREFTQCDADVVGSTSLNNEVELAIIYETVFSKLKIDIELKINSRKILAGVSEAIGAPNRMIDMAIAIDKFDKIGFQGVKDELKEKEFTDSQISDLTDFIFAAANRILPIDVQLKDGGDFILHFLKNAAPKYLSNENFKTGIAEMEEVLQKTRNSNPNSKIQIDLTLARGLNYYTGIIFEVKAKGIQMGSIGGGGRYDDLTGLFGVPNIPGVGISFGVDRIYDVLEELNLFPENLQVSTKVLFFNMGEKESAFAFRIMQQLRSSDGIACELYHEKPQKNERKIQYDYAEKKKIPFIVIIDSNAILEMNCEIKNLSTKEQQTISLSNLVDYLKNS